jgi:hypothetical protein
MVSLIGLVVILRGIWMQYGGADNGDFYLLCGAIIVLYGEQRSTRKN